MKMRSEQEMLELIISSAQADDRIRAVILEGSRANPDAARDPFQDYDLIFAVTEFEPFANNLEWIKQFGELMILQMPDLMGTTPPPANKFTYLMQFVDGNRIDLNVFSLETLKGFQFSSQSKVLLDKDNAFNLPASSNSDYLPHPPSAKEFFDCCNEFWWVAPYVAKGLWRGEIMYAKHMFESVLRKETMKLFTWHFGMKTDFKKSPGKDGKYFSAVIEDEFYRLLLKSYADADTTNNWEALEALCMAFRGVAKRVASHFGYTYLVKEDERVTRYLVDVRRLDRKAAAIY